jgi:hypothetical protein
MDDVAGTCNMDRGKEIQCGAKATCHSIFNNFPLNKPNVLNFSRNILRRFYCRWVLTGQIPIKITD